jgi:membrane protease YdiL (CAAX protease family)
MNSSLKQRGTAHGAVFLSALIAIRIGLAPQPWPWYLLLPLLAYSVIVLAWPSLRQTAPRLKVGRLVGWPLAAAVGLSIATSVALVVFDKLIHPDAADLAAKLPLNKFDNLLAAGICFSLVNATLEELIFHGLLWEFVAAEWNGCVALVGTTIVFGLGHLHGYPPGPLGAVLAGIFGLAVGVLRWWTGGLGLAIAVHVCADATIFGLISSSTNSGT